MAHNTLAQMVVKLEKMKQQLRQMDTDADDEIGTWSDPQWQAHHATYKQLEDAICKYEHSPLCFINT